MPAVPEWTPAEFVLTNPYNGTLIFNTPYPDGRRFALDGAGCSFDISVRSTKNNVPQSDGSILHHRFLTGAEMGLSVQLWDDATGLPACDAVLADMLDDLSGAFRSILNAGDNEGRLAWAVAGKANRMLDDVRLLVYPAYTNPIGTLPVVTARIDSQYPYAQDLTQTTTPILNGATVVINNTGSAAYFPVFKVSKAGGTSSFFLYNDTTGEHIFYSGTTIPNGSYAEIDTFRNTIFMNGNGADLLDSVDVTVTLFPSLVPGNNSIRIVDADVDVLWQPAWA